MSSYTECITIVWFDSEFFLFDVNHMFRSLWICFHDVNFTNGNHSINQDSAHWPMGIKMLRPMSDYLVRELFKSWRNVKLNTILQCILSFDTNYILLCPRDQRSGTSCFRRGILFLSCLSFCHSVIQWVLELWYFTWVSLVVRPFLGFHYFLPCDLDLRVWHLLFKNFNVAKNFWILSARALIFYMNIPCD